MNTIKPIRFIVAAAASALLLLNMAPVAMADNPVPTITSISPTSAANGSGSFTLTVTGTNFVPNSSVELSGTTLPTTFVSSTQLNANVPPAVISNNTAYNITVNNPGPGGGTSGAQVLLIGSATTAAPTINSISPSSVTAGSAGFTLTVNGSNFTQGALINVNGSGRTTTYVSANQLTAPVGSSDFTNPGTLNITVTNPAPNAGTSNTQTFTINPVASTSNPVPTTTSAIPNSAMAGGGDFTLNVYGSNFVPGSVIWFRGTPRSTAFVSSTQLSAVIGAVDISITGNYLIAVANPTPGGGASSSITFSVTPASTTPGLPNTGFGPTGSASDSNPGLVVAILALLSVAMSVIIVKYSWNLKS